MRRKDGELRLTAISGKVRQQHLELAEQLISVVATCEGMTREQLQAEMVTVGQSPHEAKLVKGFAKLIEDALTFEQESGASAASLREAVFERAADEWRKLGDDDAFDRNRVLGDVAKRLGGSSDKLDQDLFIDLPAAQRVIKTVDWSKEQLVDLYDESRVAAILLRAVKVRATFAIRRPAEVRALFRVLKFRRLLFELKELPSGHYELLLTGPYSLFEATTKYGLQLALTWPTLAFQQDIQIEAELRWGKKNERLTFRWPDVPRSRNVVEGVLGVGALPDPQRSNPNEDEAPNGEHPDDEVVALREGLMKALPTARVEHCEQVLQMPGQGLCIPDLCCTFADGGEVFVEVMGYWSRDAVWRRVELVEQGLAAKVLFVVSSKLRVSEEVLPETSPSALYVYRGRINPVAAAAKLSELVALGTAPPRTSKGRRRK